MRSQNATDAGATALQRWTFWLLLVSAAANVLIAVLLRMQFSLAHEAADRERALLQRVAQIEAEMSDTRTTLQQSQPPR